MSHDRQPRQSLGRSSIIEVRRLHNLPAAQQSSILHALGLMVTHGSLLFPKEVVAELERACEGKEPDKRYLWASSYSGIACRHPTDYARVASVLERVPLLVDAEKTMGAEEADPYVVALALTVASDGTQITVVTEDRKDKPAKTSLATACGLWGLSTVPLEAFLGHTGIWRRGG
jgi:uncharacterized protein DUF4411